jgi:hypothetical protein
MVALVLYSGGIDGELFDLNFDQVDDAVANTYADVFQLTHRFCFQHSRQLYACIANTMKKKYPNHNYDSPGLVSDLMKCYLWLSLLYLGLTSLHPVVSIKLLHIGGG